MKDLLSLRHWALMLIVLPTIIIGMLLGGYLTYKRYTELDQNLIERGIYLSEPLTLLSADAILQNKQAFLSDALDMAHRKASPIVRSISVFLPDHQLYLSSNYHNEFGHIRLQAGRLIPENTSVEVTEDHIYIRSPIYGPETDDDSFLFIKKNGRTLFGYLVVELSRDQALLSQQSSLFALFGMLAAAILFTFLFAISFVRNIIGPLDKLASAVQDINRGKTKTKVRETMLGELDQLRLGINEIGREIHVANERAELSTNEHTQELQQTVEQLEVQNIQLSMARRDAQKANDVKSQFLANMSHELRTPLNGVLGFTRQLKKTSLNINQRDFLETIESSAQNLLRIINDILDFSKLDAGKMELESIPFALRDTVNDVMTLLAPNIFDKGLDIHLHVDNKVPDELRGDPDRLKQIIINLIGNAIKFTTRGYIRLDVKYLRSLDKGHQIKFIISDTGVGIDEEGRKKLFAAFGQADSSVTRKYGGTGLGLIICKKLIEAMDGSISFDSDKGKGSRFYFDVYLPENHLTVGQPMPTQVLEQKRLLFLDTCSQSLADTSALINDHTDLLLTSCDSEARFHQLLTGKVYDLVLISRNVSPSSVGEFKQLVAAARQHCKFVFTAINSISPNMKEAFIGSGAEACLSLPVNHRKLINVLAAPYLAGLETDSNPMLNFAGLKVLAVDDNSANLKLLTALLAELHITADTALDGQAALQLAQKYKYDVIFMDIQMPIMDGITACKHIKESSLNEETPMVSVTAHAAPEEQRKMLDSGFNNYLAKPIDEEMLRQILFDVCPMQAPAPTSPSTEPDKDVQPEPLAELNFVEYHHIDWPLALQRAAGKQDLALEMLSMLIKSVPETISQINDAMAQDKVNELTKTVHKFHGACCYTGVPKLKKLAELIESGLKKHTDIEAVEPELLELLDELEMMQQESESWSIAV
mgnify:CR=1 FL=1